MHSTYIVEKKATKRTTTMGEENRLDGRKKGKGGRERKDAARTPGCPSLRKSFGKLWSSSGGEGMEKGGKGARCEEGKERLQVRVNRLRH